MEGAMEEAAETTWDCVIIGGGIAGLTAAIYLARAGKSVLLLEKSKRLGGRAITEEKEECFLNLGPHALYEKGQGIKILKELRIELEGGNPPRTGKLVTDNETYDFPGSVPKLLKSRLFSWEAKKELMRFFTFLKRIKTKEIQNITMDQWLQHNINDELARKFLQALIRQATYSTDFELLSAGAAIRQLQLGKPIYFHYGWKTLIDALKEQAIWAGVTIKYDAHVYRIQRDFSKLAVFVKNKEGIVTRTVLSTADPVDTASLLHELGEWATVRHLQKLLPVRTTCLDLVLKYVPDPETSFAMALDQPLYFSNHSKSATLSRHEDHAVIHVMKYSSTDHSADPAEDKHELEQFMNRVQPGWQDAVLYKRFLPHVTISHSLMSTGENEVTGRPVSARTPFERVFIAGEWVGTDSMLADSAFASGKQAAVFILEELSGF